MKQSGEERWRKTRENEVSEKWGRWEWRREEEKEINTLWRRTTKSRGKIVVSLGIQKQPRVNLRHFRLFLEHDRRNTPIITYLIPSHANATRQWHLALTQLKGHRNVKSEWACQIIWATEKLSILEPSTAGKIKLGNHTSNLPNSKLWVRGNWYENDFSTR